MKIAQTIVKMATKGRNPTKKVLSVEQGEGLRWEICLIFFFFFKIDFYKKWKFVYFNLNCVWLIWFLTTIVYWPWIYFEFSKKINYFDWKMNKRIFCNLRIFFSSLKLISFVCLFVCFCLGVGARVRRSIGRPDVSRKIYSRSVFGSLNNETPNRMKWKIEF